METSGANSDDVSVWELASLLLANRSELFIVVYTKIAQFSMISRSIFFSAETVNEYPRSVKIFVKCSVKSRPTKRKMATPSLLCIAMIVNEGRDRTGGGCYPPDQQTRTPNLAQSREAWARLFKTAPGRRLAISYTVHTTKIRSSARECVDLSLLLIESKLGTDSFSLVDGVSIQGTFSCNFSPLGKLSQFKAQSRLHRLQCRCECTWNRGRPSRGQKVQTPMELAASME